MAIDLPPVIPPEMASRAQIEALKGASGGAITATIGSNSVRVVGNTHLDESEVQELLASAATPAEAVVKLASAYYTRGHMLVRVNYYRAGAEVLILVKQLTLSSVSGEGVSHYFAALEGDSDLSVEEFERARVMANLKSERAGVDYSIGYRFEDNDRVAMTLLPKEKQDFDPTDIIVEANNKGSRFLGRYFGLVGVNHDFASGTSVSASYQTAFTDLGESRDGKSLDQFSVAADHPFALGLFGADISYIEYEREPDLSDGSSNCLLLFLLCSPGGSQQFDLNAEILQVGLSGEQVLKATPTQRLTITERLEYNDSIIELAGRDEKLLDEQYQIAEVGLNYLGQRFKTQTDSPATLNVSVKARAGFGSGGTLEDYPRFRADYVSGNPGLPIPDVVPQARTAEFLALIPSAQYRQLVGKDLELQINARGQLADEQLPQQQQFVLGGMGSLSAYLPGALIGDEGVFVSASLNKKLVWNGLDLLPAAFAEYGTSQFNNASSDLGSNQSLADAGLRLTVSYQDALYSEFVVARPLYDDVVDEDAVEALEADFFWRLRYTF